MSGTEEGEVSGDEEGEIVSPETKRQPFGGSASPFPKDLGSRFIAALPSSAPSLPQFQKPHSSAPSAHSHYGPHGHHHGGGGKFGTATNERPPPPPTPRHASPNKSRHSSHDYPQYSSHVPSHGSSHVLNSRDAYRDHRRNGDSGPPSHHQRGPAGILPGGTPVGAPNPGSRGGNGSSSSSNGGGGGGSRSGFATNPRHGYYGHGRAPDGLPEYNSTIASASSASSVPHYSGRNANSGSGSGTPGAPPSSSTASAGPRIPPPPPPPPEGPPPSKTGPFGSIPAIPKPGEVSGYSRSNSFVRKSSNISQGGPFKDTGNPNNNNTGGKPPGPPPPPPPPPPTRNLVNHRTSISSAAPTQSRSLSTGSQSSGGSLANSVIDSTNATFTRTANIDTLAASRRETDSRPSSRGYEGPGSDASYERAEGTSSGPPRHSPNHHYRRDSKNNQSSRRDREPTQPSKGPLRNEWEHTGRGDGPFGSSRPGDPPSPNSCKRSVDTNSAVDSATGTHNATNAVRGPPPGRDVNNQSTSALSSANAKSDSPSLQKQQTTGSQSSFPGASGASGSNGSKSSNTNLVNTQSLPPPLTATSSSGPLRPTDPRKRAQLAFVPKQKLKRQQSAPSSGWKSDNSFSGCTYNRDRAGSFSSQGDAAGSSGGNQGTAQQSSSLSSSDRPDLSIHGSPPTQRRVSDSKLFENLNSAERTQIPPRSLSLTSAIPKRTLSVGGTTDGTHIPRKPGSSLSRANSVGPRPGSASGSQGQGQGQGYRKFHQIERSGGMARSVSHGQFTSAVHRNPSGNLQPHSGGVSSPNGAPPPNASEATAINSTRTAFERRRLSSNDSSTSNRGRPAETEKQSTSQSSTNVQASRWKGAGTGNNTGTGSAPDQVQRKLTVSSLAGDNRARAKGVLERLHRFNASLQEGAAREVEPKSSLDDDSDEEAEEGEIDPTSLSGDQAPVSEVTELPSKTDITTAMAQVDKAVKSDQIEVEELKSALEVALKEEDGSRQREKELEEQEKEAKRAARDKAEAEDRANDAIERDEELRKLLENEKCAFDADTEQSAQALANEANDQSVTSAVADGSGQPVFVGSSGMCSVDIDVASEEKLEDMLKSELDADLAKAAESVDKDIKKATRQLEKATNGLVESESMIAAAQLECDAAVAEVEKAERPPRDTTVLFAVSPTNDVVSQIMAENRRRAAESHRLALTLASEESDQGKNDSEQAAQLSLSKQTAASAEDHSNDFRDPIHGKTPDEWSQLANNVTGLSDALFQEPQDTPFFERNERTHVLIGPSVKEHVRANQRRIHDRWRELAVEYEVRRRLYNLQQSKLAKKRKRTTALSKVARTSIFEGSSRSTPERRRAISDAGLPPSPAVAATPGVSSNASSRSSNNPYRRARRGNEVRTEYEQEQIIAEITAKEAMEKRISQGGSKLPRQIGPTERQLTARFVHTFTAQKIDDPLQEESQLSHINVWSDMEKCIFLDRFLQFPKDFRKIASFLRNKTTKDCVKFYYDSKQTVPYKGALKEHVMRRKRRGDYPVWDSTIQAAVSVGAAVKAGPNGDKPVIFELPQSDRTYVTHLLHPLKRGILDAIELGGDLTKEKQLSSNTKAVADAKRSGDRGTTAALNTSSSSKRKTKDPLFLLKPDQVRNLRAVSRDSLTGQSLKNELSDVSSDPETDVLTSKPKLKAKAEKKNPKVVEKRRVESTKRPKQQVESNGNEIRQKDLAKTKEKNPNKPKTKLREKDKTKTGLNKRKREQQSTKPTSKTQLAESKKAPSKQKGDSKASSKPGQLSKNEGPDPTVSEAGTLTGGRKPPQKWTLTEKKKFMAAMEEHGRNWSMLTAAVGTKSLAQIKNFYYDVKKQSGRGPKSLAKTEVVTDPSLNKDASAVGDAKASPLISHPSGDRQESGMIPASKAAPKKRKSLAGAKSIDKVSKPSGKALGAGKGASKVDIVKDESAAIRPKKRKKKNAPASGSTVTNKKADNEMKTSPILPPTKAAAAPAGMPPKSSEVSQRAGSNSVAASPAMEVSERESSVAQMLHSLQRSPDDGLSADDQHQLIERILRQQQQQQQQQPQNSDQTDMLRQRQLEQHAMQLAPSETHRTDQSQASGMSQQNEYESQIRSFLEQQQQQQHHHQQRLTASQLQSMHAQQQQQQQQQQQPHTTQEHQPNSMLEDEARRLYHHHSQSHHQQVLSNLLPSMYQQSGVQHPSNQPTQHHRQQHASHQQPHQFHQQQHQHHLPHQAPSINHLQRFQHSPDDMTSLQALLRLQQQQQHHHHHIRQQQQQQRQHHPHHSQQHDQQQQADRLRSLLLSGGLNNPASASMVSGSSGGGGFDQASADIASSGRTPSVNDHRNMMGLSGRGQVSAPGLGQPMSISGHHQQQNNVSGHSAGLSAVFSSGLAGLEALSSRSRDPAYSAGISDALGLLARQGLLGNATAAASAVATGAHGLQADAQSSTARGQHPQTHQQQQARHPPRGDGQHR